MFPTLHELIYLTVLSLMIWGQIMWYDDLNPLLYLTSAISSLMQLAVFFFWGMYLSRKRRDRRSLDRPT